MNEHIVAIQNMSAFHTVALNLQQEGARWSPMFWKLNHVFDIFLRQQRQAGSDSADDRNATGGLSARRRWNGERPRLESFFPEVSFPLQRRNVILNGGGINSEVPPNLPYRRREAIFVHVLVNEIQDGLLSFCKHDTLITEQMYGSQHPKFWSLLVACSLATFGVGGFGGEKSRRRFDPGTAGAFVSYRPRRCPSHHVHN